MDCPESGPQDHFYDKEDYEEGNGSDFSIIPKTTGPGNFLSRI
jgi:hypothetical protein